MSEEPVIIPVISGLTFADVEDLARLHADTGLRLRADDTLQPVLFTTTGSVRSGSGAGRLVTELLHLARFALLVREIAECRPGDSVIDAINQVHNEVRSRP